MPNTRNQHFVPQFYLRGFAKGELAFASRKDSRGQFGKVFSANIRNLCSRRDYYEVTFSTNGKSQSYVERGSHENWLSDLEHTLAPKLHNVTSASFSELPLKAKESLPYLMVMFASFMLRNPKLLDISRDEAPDLMARLISNDFFRQDELEAIESHGYTLQGVTEFAIMWEELTSIAEGSSMRKVIDWLDGTSVAIMRSRVGAQFITADFPFAFGWSGMNDDSSDELPTFAYMPLDWRTAVVFHKLSSNRDVWMIDAKDVSMWNQLLLRSTNGADLIIAKTESVLEKEIGVFNEDNDGDDKSRYVSTGKSQVQR